MSARTRRRDRIRRATNATLSVHACHMVFAFGAAWPLAHAATADVTPPALRLISLDVAFTALRSTGLYAFVAVVCSPLLGMLWLDALAHPSTLRELTRRAFERYGTAFRVSGVLLAASVLTAAVSCSAAWWLHRALATSHDSRLQDLCALALAAIPSLSVFAYLATLHDTARAAIALGAVDLRSALRLGHRVVSVHNVALRCASAALALALGVAGAVGPLLLAQAFALALTFTRAAWLAHAVDQTTGALRAITRRESSQS